MSLVASFKKVGDDVINHIFNESCLRGEVLDEGLLNAMKTSTEKAKADKTLKLKALKEKKLFIKTDLIKGELALMEKRMEGSNKKENIAYLKKEIKLLEDGLKSGKYLDEQKPALKQYLSDLKNLLKVHDK